MTLEELRQIMPYSAGRAGAFVGPLTAAMAEFGINTSRRRAAFLAQVAQESGELRYTREIASGDAYEPPSEKATELGNTEPGDGPFYKGRGLLMITGRANYTACGTALGIPLVLNPGLLEAPEGASRSAAWWWSKHGLNELADDDAFGTITLRINGGYTGLDARLRYWLRSRQAESL